MSSPFIDHRQDGTIDVCGIPTLRRIIAAAIEVPGSEEVMRRLHILGRKNHGKTTLVTDLIRALSGRGWRVGSIKHTHHRHELDVPGKDSHRHRIAGAAPVGILSPQLHAAFWPPTEISGDARYAQFAGLMANCDLVLVEGDTQTSADKIEVWRAAQGSIPYADNDPEILLLVTDDPLPNDRSRVPRSDLQPLLAWIEDRYPRSLGT